jgi:hypothetical protein
MAEQRGSADIVLQVLRAQLEACLDGSPTDPLTVTRGSVESWVYAVETARVLLNAEHARDVLDPFGGLGIVACVSGIAGLIAVVLVFLLRCH